MTSNSSNNAGDEEVNNIINIARNTVGNERNYELNQYFTNQEHQPQVDNNSSSVENNQFLQSLVNEMRRPTKTKQEIINEINSQPTLTGKCILARKYLTPQSTDTEKICKQDLDIGPCLNTTSGDGQKNGINYEIKISIHAKNSQVNFVQIRVDHDIQFYILIVYNMYENNHIGKAYIFKVPSENLYHMVVNYGTYAHGTNGVNGPITMDTLYGRNLEYALRCNPNATSGKYAQIWNELLQYEVEYHADNF
jgi:hypothetical protein